MANETELSERECDILRLVATGASNKEIAQKLVISPNTVKVHLRNIFAKIGVVSRTEATLYAIREGLVESPLTPPENGALDPTDAAVEAPVVPPSRWSRLGKLRWAVLAALIVALIAGGSALGMALTRSLALTPAAAVENPTPLPTPQRWQVRASLPEARSGLAAAAYENAIYAIAGETAQGVTGQVTRYQPDTNTWQTLAAKPLPVTDVGAVLIGEKIYVPGGRQADGQPTTRLEIYDPRHDTWESKAPLPAPRSAYALAALDGKMYLFGGWDGAQIVNTVFAYDPETDSWSEGTPMPTAREYAGAAEAGGKIYVIGGYDGKKALAANEAYYPQRDGDGEQPWEEKAPLPEARYRMGVTGLADIVYVIGGKSSSDLPPIELVADTESWTIFDTSQEQAGWNMALVGTGNFIYIMGGTNENPPVFQAKTQAYRALYTIAIPGVTR